MHATDIVAYTFDADTYCPRCIVDQLPTGEGQRFDGWAVDSITCPMSTEENLTELAHAFGIDREDERSFDSGDFPKVVFADQVRTTGDEMEGGPDYCGACHELLID